MKEKYCESKMLEQLTKEVEKNLPKNYELSYGHRVIKYLETYDIQEPDTAGYFYDAFKYETSYKVSRIKVDGIIIKKETVVKCIFRENYEWVCDIFEHELLLYDISLYSIIKKAILKIEKKFDTEITLTKCW